jgi:hypothetical protein
VAENQVRTPPRRAEHASRPRVCLASLRDVNRHAAWCSNYEFEDVIADVDDVDLVTFRPGPAHELREWVSRRLVWRRGLRQLTPYVTPGVQTVPLDRDYELFVFVCMRPADLLYLSAIPWRQRCRIGVCFMVEFYSGWLKEYAYHLTLLRAFDHVVLSFGSSVEAVGRSVGRPCHHVPLASDVARFSPHPNPPSRCIDVYSMGRRTPEAHAALMDLAARREIFYLYDTIPGPLIQPSDYRQHRDLIASCAQRTRFFLTFPAKVDSADETRGQSEVGARFFEGAAAGAVMVGRAPTAPSFAHDFDWPNAVIDIGSTRDSVLAALAPFRAEPSMAVELGRRNAVEALRRHDWSHRWGRLLAIAGLPATERLAERERRLTALADTVSLQPARG